MSPRAATSRRVLDDEDEGQESGQDAASDVGSIEFEATASSSANKRLKAAKGGKKSRANGYHVESDDESEMEAEAIEKATLCSDGYHIGSITRVKVENFMTYDYAEFCPGPNLNMVIGANGTGKSTIVSAIALGLAYSTKVLGRANEVKDYVKSGQAYGFVELSLRKDKLSNDVTIRRTITVRENKSTFKVNSVAVGYKRVQDLVKELNIQVDSLCSFLPQEKVVDFAKMSPSQLLLESERCVGSKKMVRQHNQLKEHKMKLIEAQEKLKEDQDELDRLESHQETASREVERYQERIKINKELAVLKLTVLSAEYSETKAAWTAQKAVLKAAKDHLRTLTVSEDPAKMRQNKAQKLISRYTGKLEDVRSEIKQMEDSMRQSERSMQQLKSNIDAKTSAQQALRDREKKRKDYVVKLKEEIAAFEDELSTPVEEPDLSIFKDRMDELGDALREISAKNASLRDEKEELSNGQKVTFAEMGDKRRQLDALEDVRKRRLELLKKTNPDAAAVVDWLRVNQSLFQGRIYEPVCLEINLTDPKYAAAMESAINRDDMFTFVCEEDEDYKLFASIVIDQQHKRVNIAGSRTAIEEQDALSEDQLHALGFDGTALDFLVGPEPVLNFLRASSNLHRLPFASGKVDIDQVVRARIARYVSHDSAFAIKLSRYGAKLPQVVQRALRPPLILADAVDIRQKQELQREKDLLEAKLKETEERVTRLNTKMNKLRNEDAEVRERREQLKSDKIEAQKPFQRYQRAQVQLQTLRDNLASEQTRPQRFSEERAKLKTTLEDTTRELAKQAMSYYDLVCQKAKLMERQLQWTIEQYQVRSAYDKSVEEAKTKTSALEEASSRVEALAAENVAMKEVAMGIYEKLRQSQSDADAETLRAYEADPKTTPLSELQQRQAELSSQLELIVAPTSGVIRAYENRQVQIDELRSSLASRQAICTDHQDQIDEIHEDWYPKLVSMVERISTDFEAAFERIGCAGAVRLDKEDPDYGKWGIEILIKFRDNEALQPLTAQRQSGGERAVSTVMYLMALQDFSKAPFRVVDEINQGMDARNERLMHTQFVEKSCQEGTSQYFLITPKLLPDLRYHERMTVLCVYNGEWLPEVPVSLQKLAAQRRAKYGPTANGSQPSLLTHASRGIAVR